VERTKRQAKNYVRYQSIKLDGKSLTMGKLWTLRGLRCRFLHCLLWFLQCTDLIVKLFKQNIWKHSWLICGCSKVDFVAESHPPCSSWKTWLINRQACWLTQLIKDSQTKWVLPPLSYSRLFYRKQEPWWWLMILASILPSQWRLFRIRYYGQPDVLGVCHNVVL